MRALSVVIPAWCEEATIAAAVRSAAAIGDEVVVADGGSPDATAARARDAGACVVSAARGRGAQLAAGADASTGDVLLFVHADTFLPPRARAAIAGALADPDVGGGNFLLRFVPSSPAAALFAWANDVRRRRLRIYYGDSAIFVRRNVYAAIGGFHPLPILEDYEFVRRLERHGPTAYVRDVVAETSARRFDRRPLRTLALWSAIQATYSLLDVAPEDLARFYADHR